MYISITYYIRLFFIVDFLLCFVLFGRSVALVLSLFGLGLGLGLGLAASSHVLEIVIGFFFICLLIMYSFLNGRTMSSKSSFVKSELF